MGVVLKGVKGTLVFSDALAEIRKNADRVLIDATSGTARLEVPSDRHWYFETPGRPEFLCVHRAWKALAAVGTLLAEEMFGQSATLSLIDHKDRTPHRLEGEDLHVPENIVLLVSLKQENGCVLAEAFVADANTYEKDKEAAIVHGVAGRLSLST